MKNDVKSRKYTLLLGKLNLASEMKIWSPKIMRRRGMMKNSTIRVMLFIVR